MKLKNLLKAHFDASADQKQSPVLSKNLGDAYLFKNNTLYREVRLAALKAGATYTDQPSTSYASLPLSQLEIILKSRVVPYLNNVDVLTDLEGRIPHQANWDHVADNLKQNHVFHESCHVVARAIAENLDLQKLMNGSIKDKIVFMLLEESFVNTCEFLGIMDVQEATHKIFYESNSYFSVFEDRTHLKKALLDFGRPALFQWMLLAYLQSNFLKESISEADLKRSLDLCFGAQFKLDSKNLKTLKSLSKNAFLLNPRFRYITTDLYLRLSGILQDVQQALSFDPLTVIEQNLDFKKLIESLAQFEKF